MLPDLHIDFSRDRSGTLVFLSKNFPQFIVVHTAKGFGIVNKAEMDVFLELSCFFDDPVNVGNLISGSSVSSVQLLSHVQLFTTPWTAARQASLSITNSRSLPKLMPIELVMLSINSPSQASAIREP